MTQRLYVLLASSSVATLCTLKLLQWRARKRAKLVADRAQSHVIEGPLIDTCNVAVRKRILPNAIKRASKWMSFQLENPPTPMVGQIGGRNTEKAPILKLEPDYILKPVQAKEYRGLREVAFYESIKLASSQNNNSNNTARSELLDFKTAPSWLLEHCDLVAMWLAILLQDSVVAGSETTLLSSWKSMERETDLLRRLQRFTASYYGVVDTISEPLQLNQHHILMQDVTASFSKPCVMDIKMGTQTYEPDASSEKKRRESEKYAQQTTFGFRVVGMRKYEPSHVDSDENGYRNWDKHHGRSLSTREAVTEAFATFFRGEPSESSSSDFNYNNNNEHESSSTTGKLRTRSIANVQSLLRSLGTRFDENHSLGFYSSSILIVYDAPNSDRANLRMIDFGHVRRQAGGDPGYRHGLKTLSSILADLVQDEGQAGRDERS
jgi:hypothetical protein